MPTQTTFGEETIGSPDWNSLRGKPLDGGYEVHDLLEADGTTARFTVRVLADSSISAFVTIVQAQGAAAEEQVALWEEVRQLRHANLNAPLAAGRINARGTDFVYVVSKRPDESLSDILPKRRLSVKEAGDLIENVTPALQHLHSHGLVHGYLSPAQVFALGDSIVLSTVGVRKTGSAPPLELTAPKYTPPENRGQNVTPAADVWCFGALLLETLTQRNGDVHSREEAAPLPAPFNRIVERCLDPNPDTRCKVAELKVLYEAAIPPIAAPRPRRPSRSSDASITAARSPLSKRAAMGEAGTRSVRAWIYGIALVVLLALIWLARAKHPPQRTLPTRASEPVAQTTTAATNSQTSWPTRTIAPDATTATSLAKRQPPEPAPKPSRTETPARPMQPKSADEPHTINGPIWRVVLYTYARSDEADNRVRLLNGKYPGLSVQTFSPNGPSGPFLVIAGGGLNHDEAAQLRQKVLRMGLPRDTYIQNYKQ